MIRKSTFSPGSGTDLHGGLDRNLGAPGIVDSNLPEHIADADVASDEQMGTVVDCEGKDAKEDVCLIKKAEDQKAAKAKPPTHASAKLRKRK